MARRSLGKFSYEGNEYEMFVLELAEGRVEYSVGVDFVNIDLVYVKPEHRGKGVGAKLLTAALHEAVVEGKDAYLLVDKYSLDEGMSAERLVAWYEKFGFESVSDKNNLPCNYNFIRRSKK